MFIAYKQLAIKGDLHSSFLPQEVDDILMIVIVKKNQHFVKDCWCVVALVDCHTEVDRLSKMIEEHCNRVTFLETKLNWTTEERRKQESQDIDRIQK